MTSQAWVTHDLICVSAPYADASRLKEIEPPPIWDTPLKAFTFPAMPAVALQISQALPGLDTDTAFDELLPKIDPDAHWKDCPEAELPPVPNLPNGGWMHQRRAYHWGKNKDAIYFAIGMGGGKTALTTAMMQAWDSRRILIVCPKKVIGHWPAQLAQWKFRAWVSAVRDGSVEQRIKDAKQELDAAIVLEEPGVVVINYAAILNKNMQKFLQTAGFDLVVLDEAQNIKAHGGTTSRALWQIFKKSKIKPKKILLSGTPIPHSPADIFAQFRFLDERVFGTAFTRFQARYAVMHPWIKGKIKEWIRQDELASKMAPFMFQVGREVLDLPPVQHITIPIELGPKARALYRSMEDDFYAAVDDGEITASNALVKLLRLQQMAAGYAHLDEGEDVEVDTAKQEMLAEILDGLYVDERVVVFCKFRHDLDVVRKVAEAQGRRYGEVSGLRDDLVDSKFPPNADVLGVQIQAGGAGVDLSASAYCIYYTVGFSLGDYEQSLARTHRPGQDRSVTYYHLIAENTVDERVYAALSERKDVVSSILERIV